MFYNYIGSEANIKEKPRQVVFDVLNRQKAYLMRNIAWWG